MNSRLQHLDLIAAAPDGVKRLRELILELAVRGKLVPQDPNDEPASELLKRIQAEKARLVAEGKIRKDKPLPAIGEEEKPFELPAGWEWVRLGEIGRDWGQKTPDKPFSYIDVSAIDNAKGQVLQPATIQPSDAPSRARKVVAVGTVIYSTVRPYLLNIAVMDREFYPEPIASTAFAIVHPLGGISSQYLFWYLRSPVFIRYVESVQNGIAYPAINDGQFFGGLAPIPPLPEQHHIVAKVDELMALCDRLETQQTEGHQAHATLVKTLLDTLTEPKPPHVSAAPRPDRFSKPVRSEAGQHLDQDPMTLSRSDTTPTALGQCWVEQDAIPARQDLHQPGDSESRPDRFPKPVRSGPDADSTPPTSAESAASFTDPWPRLAAHFDTLFTTEASIDALKQTILQLAVMGKLVPQDPKDEPASELLMRIQAEKARLVDEGKIRKDKPLPVIGEEEKPFEVPEGWAWVKFGVISEFINGDRGKNYPNRSEYVENGVAWINTGHIEPNGCLTTADMNFISRTKFDSLNSGKIQRGDLVYCLRGATFGKTAFVAPYEEGAIASSLMIIRPYITDLNKYIFKYLVSPFGKQQLFRFDNGSAQPNLSAGNVMLYALPLPPLPEQHRIVAKVDELMALCDQLAGQLKSAREVSGRYASAATAAALKAA